MSAELLRRAAEVARCEWAGETTGPFKDAARIHLAVADWLEVAADRMEAFGDGSQPRALAVARAYLGESST